MDDSGNIRLGVTSLNLPPGLLQRLHREGGLYMAPNGVLYCTAAVRKGLLPVLVEELLDARVVVKMAMKREAANPTLSRILNSRQVRLRVCEVP